MFVPFAHCHNIKIPILGKTENKKVTKMKKIIYLLVISLVLVCSCGEKEEKTGSIYGVITDKATGEPVRAAGVQLNTGTKKVTGDEGQYEFLELKVGDYTMQVTKTGYTDLVGYEIKVEAGKTTKGDVQIERLPAALRIVDDNRKDIDKLDFGSADSDITRSFNIFNESPEPLKWEITTTAVWISNVSKKSDVLNAGKTQGIIITIDRNKLNDGQSTTTIHVTSDNGNKALTVMAFKASPTVDYVILQAAGIMVQKTDITSGDINWTSARNLCENSIVGEYTDWRLPTLDELGTVWNERNKIGGFTTKYYWTSIKYNGGYDNQYYKMHFYNGSISYGTYSDGYNSRCRCVRSLP